MISYRKSILNAPKNKFLKPYLKPTPFSLKGEEDNSSEGESLELKQSEFILSSDSSISDLEENEKENTKEYQIIDKLEKNRISELSGSSLETKGTFDSFSL